MARRIVQLDQYSNSNSFNNNNNTNVANKNQNFNRNRKSINYCNYIKLPKISVNLTVIFFIVLSSLNGLMGDCPRLCECKWKSGKESVLCLNANLSNIPGRLDGGTQVLDLTGNDITNIPHDAFASANLLNLQKVFLSKCRLKLIERYAFRKLNNLVELDLSYNSLTMVPSQTFDSIPELREIKLSGNPIQRIVSDAFIRVPQLVRLELCDCKISSVDSNAFSGLETSLEWLKLDGNKLIEIRHETLTRLTNLHGLELARNPWNCSCNLRPLRAWMLRENIPYGIPPSCRSPPRLSGKTWDKIDLDEFACIPQIVAPDAKAHGVEGKNITMSCLVEGIPEPNVRWIVKNRVIANLSGETVLPATQGRKMYMVNLLKNASNLTILTADVQDAGIYTCLAENKAGRVEASVLLAVSRKPPVAPLGAKVILICIFVAVLFVVGSSFAAICFCSLKKKRKITRWNAPTRSDSYEKIEMNRKPEVRPFRNEENGYIRPHHPESGIAIVNPTKKNGDYRNVPTDDDGTGCEDNNDSNTGNLHRRDNNPKRWKSSSLKSPATMESQDGKRDEADLHIPRLIDISSNTDSNSSSISSQVDANNRQSIAATHLQSKSTWSSQLLGKKHPPPLNLTERHSSSSYGGNHEGKSHFNSTSNTAETELYESERKYPDLLEVSIFGNTTTSNNATTSNAFCTLPRKMKSSGKYFKSSSDSQSPLLPDSSSKYGSSTLGDSSFSGEFSNRRFSVESCSNYPLSHHSSGGSGGAGRNQQNQRASSFLNLVTSSGAAGGSSTLSGKLHHHRRNPSLPSSPVRESQRAFSSAATPLLDFSSLTSRSAVVPSSSTKVNAYDYHAAQLERFLEEYRNLQEQLCKMKETCESIRKKEAPLRGALGHSAQFADPVIFNAAITGSNLVLDHSSNPKTILKNKSILPGQPPEPPPYWLHRNAMLKRLNDSQPEFFQS